MDDDLSTIIPSVRHYILNCESLTRHTVRTDLNAEPDDQRSCSERHPKDGRPKHVTKALNRILFQNKDSLFWSCDLIFCEKRLCASPCLRASVLRLLCCLYPGGQLSDRPAST